jgi:hypothetical protein
MARDRRRSFLASCYHLDGSEAYTERWVSVLEAATCQTELRSTTLLPYVGICEGSWFRRKRAWCPRCLAQWAVDLGRDYEPLLWSIAVVRVCPVHEEPLLEICPRCCRRSTPLSGFDAPGVCAGCRDNLREVGCETNRVDVGRYEIWAAHQAAALIAGMRSIATPFGRKTFSLALSRLLPTLSATTKCAVAKATGSSKRSIDLWRQGATLPRVESLFRLCFHIGIPVLDFLRGSALESYNQGQPPDVSSIGVPSPQIKNQRPGCPIAPHPTELEGRPVAICASPCDARKRAAVQPPPLRVVRSAISTSADKVKVTARKRENRLRSMLEQAVHSGLLVSPRKLGITAGYTSPDRVLRRFFDLTGVLKERLRANQDGRRGIIRTKLREALVLIPPPTLDEIAISLKMSNSSRLRVCEPWLCEKMHAKRLQWQRAQQDNADAIVSAALQGQELISLKKLCKRQGISLESFISRFPGLKLEYQTRYQLQISRKRLEQNLLFQSEVARAVRSIVSRGEYPSAGRVLAENSMLRSRGWDQIQRAIRMALELLNRGTLGTDPSEGVVF